MNTEEDDPVVICGMGCRLPGDVKTPSDFWELIVSGRSSQSDVPVNRFNIDKWHHPDPKKRGGIVARGGYFLSHDDSYRNFDPSFFGIHPLEAASMDPQQRKLLEVVYETFESAGVSLDDVSSSRTACYVGAFTGDFGKILQRDPEAYWPYQSTGTDMTILSNRVNYVFNLKGPSLTVDTACSSSLYALHLAIQGLRLHEFDAAVVAGTNIVMDVAHQLTATKLGILSPTSTCHTFDSRANGFGRGEGITTLYVKRLSDALTNGDPIRGVIRATAINTNGKGVGISHPGLKGQEAVMRQAYANVNLDFGQTTYLECHGTGTPVGDPIEVAAVGNVFSVGRSGDNPILLSSVKSQIGHTEGASGIAAIQKAVMAMEEGLVPATIGIETVNPGLDLRGGRVKIVQNHLKWPTGYRRAGVNGFGYGGANAHVILDASESYLGARGITLPYAWTTISKSLPQKTKGERKHLLVTSAHSLESVQQNIMTISATLPKCRISELAYTLTKRTHFHHRSFVLVSAESDLATFSEQWTTGEGGKKAPRVAFVFTGQGAQWPRMGIRLVDQYRIFKKSFANLQQHLTTVPDRPPWTLHEALAEPPETSWMMKDVTVTVTLCTAIQICLVDLLMSWGVQPVAVVGHSSGEAAAAYCAGHLTASEAIVTSYYRALALKRNPTVGAMMAVGLGVKAVTKYIVEGREVYVGCHNSPESVTLSGRLDEIDRLEAVFKYEGIFARNVKSSGYANHSPLVQEAAKYFRKHFESSVPGDGERSNRTSRARMYSCITGGEVLAQNVGVNYWAKNISAPVLFDEALQELLRSEPDVDYLIEIGPHSALAGPIRQTKAHLGFGNDRLAYLPTLVRGNDGLADMLRLAGRLYLAGYPVDIQGANLAETAVPEDERTNMIVDLPNYQWAYDKIHWSQHRRSQGLLFRKHPRHDLLGSFDPSSTPSTAMWRNVLSLSDVPWIADHKIGASVLVPASAYLAMAIEAIRQVADDHGRTPEKFVLNDVVISSPIRLSGNDEVETTLELRTEGDRWKLFKISSVTMAGKWTDHVSGLIRWEEGNDLPQAPSPHDPVATSRPLPSLYKRFEEVGLNYGQCFRTLSEVKQYGSEKAAASLGLHPTKNAMTFESEYFVHPASMDGCLQLAFAGLMGNDHVNKRSYLPSAFPEMTIWAYHGSATTEKAFVRGEARVHSPRSVEAEFELIDRGYLRMQGKVDFLAVEGLAPFKQATIPEPFQYLSWYPDIDFLHGSKDAAKFAQLGDEQSLCSQEHSATDPVPAHTHDPVKGDLDLLRMQCLRKLLRLLVFKRPGMTMLIVESAGDNHQAILDAVNGNYRHPAARRLITLDTSGRLEELTSHGAAAPQQNLGEVDFHHDFVGQGMSQGSIEVLLITAIPERHGLSDLLRKVKRTLTEDAYLIICADVLRPDIKELQDGYSEAAWSAQLTLPDLPMMLARKNFSSASEHINIEEVLWLIHDESTYSLRIFENSAQQAGIKIRTKTLSDISHLPKNSKVLALVEIEKPIISDINGPQLHQIQILSKRATSLYWVTSGEDPRLALMQGMAKSLRSETAGLDLRTIHIESNTCDLEHAAKLILQLATRGHDVSESMEQNLILRNDCVWISRYAVDEERNSADLARSRGNGSDVQFNEGGAYLLVGCLGGLGRSLTKWMRQHGARHFIFLSRSGADKPEAASLIKDLSTYADMTAQVIRGDVCNREDVQRAVGEATLPIKGVIQAAVIYNDSRFDQMTPEIFNSVLRPKVVGTMNLHQATLQYPLDFFVMLSSSIGLVGASTQTHYTAANAFLDAMARYRRSEGWPGISLSLGMIEGIGRFQDNRALTEILKERGAYGISESEFLRIMGEACSPIEMSSKDFVGAVDEAVIVTAADPTRFLGKEMPEWCINDPRLSHIAHVAQTLQPHRENNSKVGDQCASEIKAKAVMPGVKTLEVKGLVEKFLLERLSKLVLIPSEKLEQSLHRPLSELGMDSIVGVELQSWLWRELRVALDFMELFASQMELASLIDTVTYKVLNATL